MNIDHYFIKVDDDYILYYPLKKQAMMLNTREFIIAQNYLANRQKEMSECSMIYQAIDIIESNKVRVNFEEVHNDEIIVLLTPKCNMKCKYCYANEYHLINRPVNMQAIYSHLYNYISSSDADIIRLRYLGGGEPTIEWEKLVQTTNYVKSIAIRYNKRMRFGVTTNGTLLDEDKIKWLVNNEFEIEISFDILPEIQNQQRPIEGKNSFDLVNRTLVLLQKYKANAYIRTTITELSVLKMKDMVKYVISHYPYLNRLRFEAESNVSTLNKNYCDKFIESFMSAKFFAKSKGIILKNSIADSINRYRYVFCNPEFCVNSDGELSTCHRAAYPDDLLGSLFMCGDQVDSKTNKTRCNELVTSCNRCFAKWHCAGGCLYNRYLYSKSKRELYCYFTRKMISQELKQICVDYQNTSTINTD